MRGIFFVILIQLFFACESVKEEREMVSNNVKITISYQDNESSPYLKLKYNDFYKQYLFTWEDTIYLEKVMNYKIYSEEGNLVDEKLSDQIIVNSFEDLYTGVVETKTRLFFQYIEHDTVFTHNLKIHGIPFKFNQKGGDMSSQPLKEKINK